MLNDIIKKEAREEFNKKYGGKLGRTILRNLTKKAIKKNKGKNESMLGKMRNRQERKAMAKSLKIPFTPKYNAPFTKMGFKLIPAKNEKYTKLVLEVK